MYEPSPSSFDERSFFLAAFHGTTLTFLLPAESDLGADSLAVFSALLDTLRQAGISALVLAEQEPLGLGRYSWTRLDEEPARGLYALRHRQGGTITAVLPGAGGGGDFLSRAAEVATTLRLSRLIIAHGAGAIRDRQGHAVNFINSRRLPGLASDQARAGLLSGVRRMLAGGVEAVSLCRLADVAAELFTFEGCGTYFAPHHYCQVRPLTWEDYPQARNLVERGESEGYLLPRGEEALFRVLAGGFGAFVGGHRLAGLCGLVSDGYGGQGEIVSLYTLTRFKGEGVGGYLLKRLKREARERGLSALFACTRREAVVGFFTRRGFEVVDHQQVPAAKWDGYDALRKREVTCVRWSPA